MHILVPQHIFSPAFFFFLPLSLSLSLCLSDGFWIFVWDVYSRRKKEIKKEFGKTCKENEVYNPIKERNKENALTLCPLPFWIVTAAHIRLKGKQ
jgi:hypothetical protein